MIESIEDKILTKSKKCGRGSVFFVNDFVSYRLRERKTTSRCLSHRGTGVRVIQELFILLCLLS